MIKFPPLVIVDEKQKWAHVSIPKCACTSIRVALESHFDMEPVAHGRKWPRVETLEWLSNCGPDWYTWAIIRDPYSRLISVWQEKCCNPDLASLIGPQLRPLSGQPFDVFCREVCKLVESPPENEVLDTHITPMCHFLLYNGTPVVKTIKEMYELNYFWPDLQNQFGFPELKHLNASVHNPTCFYYTRELIDLVERAYYGDLNLWWN
jgi:hypothetical protein